DADEWEFPGKALRRAGGRRAEVRAFARKSMLNVTPAGREVNGMSGGHARVQRPRTDTPGLRLLPGRMVIPRQPARRAPSMRDAAGISALGRAHLCSEASAVGY